MLGAWAFNTIFALLVCRTFLMATSALCFALRVLVFLSIAILVPADGRRFQFFGSQRWSFPLVPLKREWLSYRVAYSCIDRCAVGAGQRVFSCFPSFPVINLVVAILAGLPWSRADFSGILMTW